MSVRTPAWVRRPLIAILLVAPWFGEAVTTSTPALDLLLPWNLAFMVGLYGCGALLCREIARRSGFGLPGLALLGAAYGVWEEALVDRYWFKPSFWDEMDVGTYSVVADTNLLIATHLTIFHSAVSICASVLVVEHLFPDQQSQPWVGRRGMVIAAVVLAVVVPFVYGEFDQLPATRLLVAAGVLCAVFIGAAFVIPRPPTRSPRPAWGKQRLAWIVFACASAHILLVYGVAQTTMPWPLGIAAAVAPVILGIVLVRRLAGGGPYGPDALLVIIGLLGYHLLIGFFIGLGGRVDISIAALATALALRQLYSRSRARSQ